MGYVENNLLKGEEIVYKAKIHWAIFIPTIVWCIITVLFMTELNDVDNSADFNHSLKNTILLMIVITICCFIHELLKMLSSEYVLTTKRLILKSGIISRKTTELMLTKCEGVSVEQSILGRILNYGTLKATTGGVTSKYKKIANPVFFRNRINEQTDLAHSSVK